MRGSRRSCLSLALLLIALGAVSSAAEPSGERSAERAGRRAYAGSPPVIPHEPLGANCTTCHGGEPIKVEGLGLSPASPHTNLGRFSNCRQCHVSAQTNETFRTSDFAGLAPVGEPSHRANPLAPPVIPHPIFMRERCLACHGGEAARAELRTTHPDRINCRQCHIPGPAAAKGPLPPQLGVSPDATLR